MKILILSDLHLEFAEFNPPKVDCDVVVLAGDTDLKLRGIRWAMETFPDIPVLYVFGNHEFYGEKWPRLIEKGRELAKGTNVCILENDTIEIAGWRFFGTTLWSDFGILGDSAEAAQKAAQEMTDFRRIRHWPTLKRFSPTHAKMAFAHSVTAIQNFLFAVDRRKSVMITHHAPSMQSLPVQFRSDPISGAYASNLESLILEAGPRVWIHGHIHQKRSYVIGETRILANPRGYPNENTGFIDEVIYIE